MSAARTPVSLRLTPEEYFAWEETQEEKHDYVHGEVFTMAGASRTHNDIAGNLCVELRLAFRGAECFVFMGDMRVQIEAGGRYTYPDLAAACGALEFVDARETTLVNPALLVEVLSESTETYDRTEKLALYRHIPSVLEVVLVQQDRHALEVYRRNGDARWTLEEITDGPLALTSVGVEVGLEDVYAETEL